MLLEEWCEKLNGINPGAVLRSEHPDYRDYSSLVTAMYDADIPSVKFLKRLVEDTRAESRLYDKKLKDFPVGQEFADLPSEVQRDTFIAAPALVAVHERFAHTRSLLGLRTSTDGTETERLVQQTAQRQHSALLLLLSTSPSVKQPWNESKLIQLLSNLNQVQYLPLGRIFRFIELWANKNTWTDALARALQPVVGRHARFDPHLRKRAAEIGKPKPATSQSKTPRVFAIQPCDAWTAAIVPLLNARSELQRTKWTQLLAHCETAKASSPSKTFLKKSQAFIDAVGCADYIDVMSPVLGSIGSAYGEALPEQDDPWAVNDTTLLDDRHTNLLRGLVWSASLVDDETLLTALAGAADRCFQKVRGVGPRAPKIGNACLWVFAHSESFEAVAQLNRLFGRVKHASVRKQIERALNAAAEHHKLTRSDLEDMAVPTCGLTNVGEIRQVFGDYTADLQIVSTTTTHTRWHAPNGKLRKSIPKAVKEDFAAELKAWKANEKLLKQTIAGQRNRLESFYQTAKAWIYSDWRERLLDHPLMGWLAQRLIWSFDQQGVCSAALWHEGKFVDAEGETIGTPPNDATVTLWHPIEATTECVQAWRSWMLEHEITQPFKQAHREVYVLTDAERNTVNYSNRFAAHVIKQHQFRALCQTRGWQFDLMGNWDSHNVPELLIPEQQIRAEFWVEDTIDVVSPAGIFLYLATDQVRFYECDAESYARDRWSARRGEPLPLDQIPPLVFSEVMRDVDLFVGVASVGNDPNWQDGGPEGRYQDYWASYSFGDLSATAQTRRDILERLIPRLKIADRCSFDEKFLIVRGEKRTYKIHLGSSNILMEPNDQYLCIVPGRGAGPGDTVFLPFEGDQRLAVILSKAMMLADDTTIKDPTIVSQIGR